MVFTPLFAFCLSRLKSIWILKSGPVSETIKTVFPCSGILYLCFKSLGLGITSVLLNPFKMAATYPFWGFPSIKESSGQLIPARYTLDRSGLINSNKFPFWIENLLEWDRLTSLESIHWIRDLSSFSGCWERTGRPIPERSATFGPSDNPEMLFARPPRRWRSRFKVKN